MAGSVGHGFGRKNCRLEIESRFRRFEEAFFVVRTKFPIRERTGLEFPGDGDSRTGNLHR